MKPIYLDYAATTPVDPRVATAMQACLQLEGNFGNPSSQHMFGKSAHDAVEQARCQVAALLHAEPSEIIWTSGATESDNLAIKGVAQLYQRKGKHIITMKTEHKAVLDACQHLEKNDFELTYLSPESNGLLDLDKLKAAIRKDTILVSIMHVNNETGIIQDLAAIASLTAAHGVLFHVDAAQSAGKIPIDVQHIPIDLLTVTAHKVYGPKGIGALYLRKKPRVRVEPLIHGGGHEQGMRSGTLATHQIVGMGAAFALAQTEMEQDTKKITALRYQFLSAIKAIPAIKLNCEHHTVPHILNIRFENMLADEILKKLNFIAASTASACQGKGTEGSYVLAALGLNQEQTKSSIRFSFGRFNTEQDIQRVTEAMQTMFCNSII